MRRGAPSRRRLVSLALVAALYGCDSASSTPTASTTTSASAAPAFDYLPIDGSWKNEPLKIASAVAFSRGGSALHVSLSSHPLTCRDLKRGVQKVPGEVAVDLTLAPLLGVDGKETWSVTRARFGPITRQGNLAPVTLSTFSPQETIATELDAGISFPPDELRLKGAFDIAGCGLMPWDKDARVLKQEQLKVTLAGKTLPMNGATFEVERDGKRTLRISTEPHACGATVGSDVALIITLPKKDFGAGDAVSPVSVRAEGYMLPRPIGAKEVAALEVKPVAEGDGGGAPAGDLRRLEVTGELSLSGYALTVAGTVSAQSCETAMPKR